MRKIKRRRQPSPALVVTATAVCVISLVIISNLITMRRSRINAKVEIADPPIETIDAQIKKVSPAFNIPDGEVERAAVRVREASALAMGLTLLAVNEALASRSILNVETLLTRFVSRHLLPPGIKPHNSKGTFESVYAVIYVRYRTDPLAVEIVSIGRNKPDGPPIIARIATGSDENAGATLFLARQINDVAIPEPFAQTSRMTAMNWSIEPMRERSFSAQELDQINGWLRSRSVGN
ncbi:MAG: hypothetical protein L0226_08930 [Acidobacteria bacterium]|nr:hypothetical protein [Acidobacteriota bacterium]